MTTLKEIRINNNITQKDCAGILGVSLRTYITYENDESKTDSLKYKYMLKELEERFKVTENKGILQNEFIIKTCESIFKDYNVEYCYLFGSYAKGNPKETSDVDLLISLSESGLKFYEILEKLREALNKKVDLLNIEQLKNNTQLTNEILKSGVKIYG